ncbi:MAG: histidine phosphatase family protein [Sandaracinaceae bacterium]|nr:histidine phosphatase family protein [Sandaracinaceae bacterium]
MSERAPIELTLVRHGESTYNVTGRWQGQGDAPLSELGKQQAARVGARLAGETFDKVVSSDLTRAHHTALATGHPVDMRREWREIDVGRWEGLTREEVAERYPDEVHGAFSGEDVKIGGAESWADLSARVDQAMLTLLRELQPGARAAVVAHGGVIASLLSGILGLTEHRPRPIGRISNTAISRLHIWMDAAHQAPAHARLVGFNDATHAFTVPAWAAEMQKTGHVLTTLVADGAAPPLHAFPRVDEAAAEHVSRVAGAGDVARGLADALGVPFEPITLTAGAERAMAALPIAPGRRVVVLPPADIARLAGERMRHAPDGPSSVALPQPGSSTNVVVTSKGLTFADYSAVPHEG